MSFERMTRSGVTFYRAEGLGTVHGFSTRHGGVSAPPFDTLNLGLSQGDDPACVRENFRRFCAAVGADVDRMVVTHQVHQDNVRIATSADAGKGLDRERDYDVDGLITNERGLPLVIHSADCIPVLLHDPVKQVIGACHAGWRGTALGIAAKTVREMQRIFGCDPADIRAAIGPAIGQCCFETDGDVPAALHAALGDEAEPYITWNGRKYHIDLKAINALWLRKSGVTQIDVSGDCTACRTDLYWSHRKHGGERGSQIAMISLEDTL